MRDMRDEMKREGETTDDTPYSHEKERDSLRNADTLVIAWTVREVLGWNRGSEKIVGHV